MTDNEMIKINRARLILKPFSLVMYKGDVYKISNVINSDKVLISQMDDKKNILVEISDLESINSNADIDDHVQLNSSEITDSAWEIALDRYETIKGLINSSTTEEVLHLAEVKNIHQNTIWKWLKAYRENQSILALVPRKRGWKTNKPRISPELEQIIKQAINDEYLSARKPSVSKTIRYVKAECLRNNIEPPHDNTIRKKISLLDQYQVIKARQGKKSVRDKYKAVPGTFPNATYPLACVQIDHTPLDIEIVDDEYREAIGRPYLTLAIDVFSRMVVGYYISLEAPSAVSVAMCISSSILSKKKKLLDLNIDADWCAEGLMDSIHSDNGSDFRTQHLMKACLKYGINWEYRPIGGAQFGGHIERMLGVINLEMHILDGTTKSNISQKGSYDSARNACLTIDDLEYYFVYWLTKIYHCQKHSAIEMSPLQKWDEGIWGNKFVEGTGLKERVADEQTLFLDFAPEFEATVQRTGVQKNKLFYFADCLRPWINYLDPSDTRKRRKQKFIFKRDPRDISKIWFYEPRTNQYLKVPTAKKEIPSISLFEYQQVQKYLKSERLDDANQEEIYKAILHLRDVVNTAKSKTRKQRRINQRRLESNKIVSAQTQLVTQELRDSTVNNKSESDIWNIKLTAFDDLR